MLIGEPVNNSHMHLETISCPNLGIVSIISKHLLNTSQCILLYSAGCAGREVSTQGWRAIGGGKAKMRFGDQEEDLILIREVVGNQ